MASALLGFLVLVIAARELGPVKYATFAILWGVFYSIAGVLSGLQQETARTISNRVRVGGRAGAPPFWGSLIVGLCVVMLLLVTAPTWAPSALDEGWLTSTLVLCLGSCGLTVYVAMCGSLAAAERWTLLGSLVAGEAMLRLAVALVVFGNDDPVAQQAMVVAVGPFIALILTASARSRSDLLARGSTSLGGHMKRSLYASVSSGSSALLMSGFPALVALTTRETLPQSAGVLFAAITLTRAPILVPLNGARLKLVMWLTEPAQQRGRTSGASMAFLGLGVLIVTVGLAFSLGPLALKLTFGFDASASLLALLAATGVLTGLLTVTGVALIASDAHSASMLGWLLALIVAIGCFALPLSLEQRCVLGLFLSPAAGTMVHLVTLRRISLCRGSQRSARPA